MVRKNLLTEIDVVNEYGLVTAKEISEILSKTVGNVVKKLKRLERWDEVIIIEYQTRGRGNLYVKPEILNDKKFKINNSE